MGLIEVASNNSVWRGMDYYERKMVKTWKVIDDTCDGVVKSDSGNEYAVHIDKSHPRKSTCNCAFADGRRVVCKHMIALYFTSEPNAAKDFLDEVEKWEQEEELMEQQHYEDMRKYVNSLTKAELRERLLDALVQLEERRDRYW